MALTKRELEDLNERLQGTIVTLREEMARLRAENASLSEQLALLTDWSETSATYYRRLKRCYENLSATANTADGTEISVTPASVGAGRAGAGEDGDPCGD